jgi:hypothetical protein
MPVQKVPKAPLRERLKLVATVIGCVPAIDLVFGLLLFYTPLGGNMPNNAVKVWSMILCWIVTVWFLLAHRTPDHKDVKFRIW